MKKFSIVLMLLVIFGGVVLSGCGLEKQDVQDAARLEGNARPEVEYLMAGKVEATEKVDIASRITAKILVISGDVGRAVKKGELLVKLDTKDLEVQTLQASAAVVTAQANLSKTMNGARPEQVAQAQATYGKAKNDYERTKALFDLGAVSRQQLENAQLAAVNAKEQLAITAGGSPDDIKVAQSELQQTKAALDSAMVHLDDGIIAAPISGIISAKHVNSGEVAAAGTPLLTLVNPETLVINAYLPVALMSKIQSGQEVVIKISELSDEEYRGEVSAVDTVVDPKYNSILVKVSIKNHDDQLKPGMVANIGVRR